MLYGLLALLAADYLTLVRDALAEVRLRTLDVPHFRSELTDALLVGTRDRDRRLLNGRRETFGNRKRDLVRETDVENEVVALELDFVADTLEDEDLLPGSFDAVHHGADMRCIRTGKRAGKLRVVLRSYEDAFRCHVDGDRRVDRARECFLLAFDREDVVRRVDGHLRRYRDGFLSEA